MSTGHGNGVCAPGQDDEGESRNWYGSIDRNKVYTKDEFLRDMSRQNHFYEVLTDKGLPVAKVGIYVLISGQVFHDWVASLSKPKESKNAKVPKKRKPPPSPR